MNSQIAMGDKDIIKYAICLSTFMLNKLWLNACICYMARNVETSHSGSSQPQGPEFPKNLGSSFTKNKLCYWLICTTCSQCVFTFSHIPEILDTGAEMINVINCGEDIRIIFLTASLVCPSLPVFLWSRCYWRFVRCSSGMVGNHWTEGIKICHLSNL